MYMLNNHICALSPPKKEKGENSAWGLRAKERKQKLKNPNTNGDLWKIHKK